MAKEKKTGDSDCSAIFVDLLTHNNKSTVLKNNGIVKETTFKDFLEIRTSNIILVLANKEISGLRSTPEASF